MKRIIFKVILWGLILFPLLGMFAPNVRNGVTLANIGWLRFVYIAVVLAMAYVAHKKGVYRFSRDFNTIDPEAYGFLLFGVFGIASLMACFDDMVAYANKPAADAKTYKTTVKIEEAYRSVTVYRNRNYVRSERHRYYVPIRYKGELYTLDNEDLFFDLPGSSNARNNDTIYSYTGPMVMYFKEGRLGFLQIIRLQPVDEK